MLSDLLGVACLTWCGIVLCMSTLGYIQIILHYRKRTRISSRHGASPEESPHVTIIRPIKGLEPDLYECLASTFHQDYPHERFTICLCVPSRQDPAMDTLNQLVSDFPHHDAKILVEDEDEALQSGSLGDFGPNPKIRNMSRAYREAKGDIVWIIDCNVWVGKGVARQMVDLLCGFGGGGKPYKFVHQLPLVVDITQTHSAPTTTHGRTQHELQPLTGTGGTAAPSSSHYERISTSRTGSQTSMEQRLNTFGGRLDEVFLSSAHAKFYTGINTVAVAPCIVGKSNMFRRSHLNALTDGRGIDHFSQNICEDHLIGDLLWKKPQPFEIGAGSHDEGQMEFGKHAMLFGEVAIQPTAYMSLNEYVARRVRWLRVRKFTVTMATLVEPGTECFVFCAYLAWGLTHLSFLPEVLQGWPSWLAFATVWLGSVTAWFLSDWALFRILQSMASVQVDADTPAWARGPQTRSFQSWLVAWLGRESLALPIWLWAVWGGTSVVWRGRRFKVGFDMKVHSLDQPPEPSAPLQSLSRSITPKPSGKDRLE